LIVAVRHYLPSLTHGPGLRASSNPIRQTRHALHQIPGDQGMQRLPRHPTELVTSVAVARANTARTASNRCSTTDNATSANPRHPISTTSTEHRQTRWPNTAGVKHQPTHDCQASAATGQGSTFESGENFLYGFKAASGVATR
jgi:hypothetical protein